MGADAEMGQAGGWAGGGMGRRPGVRPGEIWHRGHLFLAWDHMRERVGWLGLPVEGEDLPLEDTVGCED